jgi:hypothetical protein
MGYEICDVRYEMRDILSPPYQGGIKGGVIKR